MRNHTEIIMKKTYGANLDNLDDIYADIENFCKDNNVDSAATYSLNLCIDEIFTNIVTYGYKNDDTKEVEIELVKKDAEVVAKIRDYAPEFNPLTEAESPNISADIDERDIGGLGIFFLSKNMDSLTYSSRDGVNELVMVKKLAK